MTGRPPMSYQEIIEVLDDLPSIVRHARRARGGISMRQVARESGIALTTLTRAEHAIGDLNLLSVRRLLAWLDSAPYGDVDERDS